MSLRDLREKSNEKQQRRHRIDSKVRPNKDLHMPMESRSEMVVTLSKPITQPERRLILVNTGSGRCWTQYRAMLVATTARRHQRIEASIEQGQRKNTGHHCSNTKLASIVVHPNLWRRSKIPNTLEAHECLGNGVVLKYTVIYRPGVTH